MYHRSAAFCLCVGLSWLLGVNPIPVQAQSEEPLEVKEVVVSSTRLPDAPVDARTLPAKVNVITAEDIRKSGAKTVQEAIQWANNIVMYDQLGNAFQQTIDLRGFSGQPVPSTSVFVDGQRINEPDFNTINFDLIPFDTIERIEIIPGPATIYGKNAMGGVINIITKRGGEKRQVTGEAMGGSWGRQRYSINASGPIGKIDYYLNLAKETEDGYRDSSAANISRVYGRVGYRPTEETDLALSYTFVKDKLEQAGVLPLSVEAINRRASFTPGDFVDHDTNVVRLTGRQGLPWGFSLNVNGFYRNLDEQLFGVGQPAFPGSILSTAQTNSTTQSWGGTVQLTQGSPIFGHQNSLVIGTDIQRNEFGSRLMSTSGFGPFNSQTDTNENILGLYAQDMLSLFPNLILTAGVRYDQDTIQTNFEDSFTPPGVGKRTFYRTNPRAGLTYLVAPTSSLYFNFSQGFRVPTFFELFPVVGLSNPNLKSVTSDNFEIGGKTGLWNWGEASVALFNSNVQNEIYFTCTNCDVFSAGFDGLNRNIDSTRRRGIEASFKGRYNEYFDGMINYTFTEATFQSMFNISTTKTVMPGDTIPSVPKNRLSVTGNVHPVDGLTLTLIGLYVSAQFYQNDETNSQPRLPGYFLLNGRLAYERKVPGGRLTGFLMVNNILNQKYSTFGTIANNTLTGGGAQEQFVSPAPTLAIYGGLSYRFEGL
ncbi:MAG TPA: TonB-dependent receptor [Nitrospiraceae bacterium]|nr:TonB-dependent receptor [Nitrospiraceae bacterium]